MNKDEIAGLRGLSDDALQKVSNAFDYGETLNVASMRQIVEILADELEMIISQPDCDGDFEGDVWFGHPEKRTLGTHIWRAGLWHELPTELDAVISLLGQARSQRDANADALTTLSAERDDLKRRLDNICMDIHTCNGDDCERPVCVERRKNAILSARVETLEAVAKAERDRLRNLPDETALEVWINLPAKYEGISKEAMRAIATALADALESKP